MLGKTLGSTVVSLAALWQHTFGRGSTPLRTDSRPSSKKTRDHAMPPSGPCCVKAKGCAGREPSENSAHASWRWRKAKVAGAIKEGDAHYDGDATCWAIDQIVCGPCKKFATEKPVHRKRAAEAERHAAEAAATAAAAAAAAAALAQRGKGGRGRTSKGAGRGGGGNATTEAARAGQAAGRGGGRATAAAAAAAAPTAPMAAAATAAAATAAAARSAAQPHATATVAGSKRKAPSPAKAVNEEAARSIRAAGAQLSVANKEGLALLEVHELLGHRTRDPKASDAIPQRQHLVHGEFSVECEESHDDGRDGIEFEDTLWVNSDLFVEHFFIDEYNNIELEWGGEEGDADLFLEDIMKSHVNDYLIPMAEDLNRLAIAKREQWVGAGPGSRAAAAAVPAAPEASPARATRSTAAAAPAAALAEAEAAAPASAGSKRARAASASPRASPRRA
jgi:hypothetical protein